MAYRFQFKVSRMTVNFQLQFTMEIWKNDKNLLPVSKQDKSQVNNL